MKDGFIKAAAVTPQVRVADVDYNTEQIISDMHEAAKQGAKLIVFPELCISGYSCRDIFFNDLLLDKCRTALLKIAAASSDIDALIFVGLPIAHNGKLYNAAAALNHGRILGLVPKLNVPNYGEFYETRQFTPGFFEPCMLNLADSPEFMDQYQHEHELNSCIGETAFEHTATIGSHEARKDSETDACRVCNADSAAYSIANTAVPFGAGLIFRCSSMPLLKVGVEICEDLWVPIPPSTQLALHGAYVIANLSASNEITGKSSYRRGLVAEQSGRTYTAYIYANASWEESTQDIVLSGHNIIAEAGTVLKESKLFSTGIITTELDLKLINSRREHMSTYPAGSAGASGAFSGKNINVYGAAGSFNTANAYGAAGSFNISNAYAAAGTQGGSLTYGNTADSLAPYVIDFDLAVTETVISRFIDPHPFVPSDNARRERRCEEILDIQTYGLMKRIKHTGSKAAVIGISGGLDSTLALTVAVRAFDKLGLSREGIIGVTMPGFGTTDRTYDNAVSLIKELGISFKEINISEAVRLHFRQIGHDESVHDTTYENAQARMRTMLLMDIANQAGGLVVGTGDMSELALGWATYNGDHMSMYGVNAGVPKTLVRYLVAYYADYCGMDKVKAILYDVLDTPVSPELLPPESDGSIAQKTEDLVGPYELHDFFLYHFMRNNSSPRRILRLALIAFGESYSKETILKWEKNFFRRFFAQQFKRSCLPDGPKVGTVCLSPRGDWRMASDTSSALWLKELEKLEDA